MNKILKLIFTTTLLLSSTVLCTTEKNELNEIRTYEGVHLSSINDFRENSIRGPQHINIEDYKLEIYGLVEKPIKYTYDEIRSKFDKNKKVVTLHCVEGWSVKILWEGVQVEDIIEESAVKEEANTMIFYAHDGYSTSLPLEYILENDIMIAFKMNDIILPPERGFPFELVAEGKWGYKWIKWIIKVELSDNENYRGFWESRGYSNTADINKEPREE
ncbi:molybdopterin-dependent oxidoreductase [candidate division WOR-3 bacterium]|jgi:DMSO/TMAO reductase YedYZ molybdopterin-dependent catalytic subunit|nr:molybdopterin-dependent oxidoreductase [candidate division WOR-3 bacterium]